MSFIKYAMQSTCERAEKMKNRYKHRWNVSYKFNNVRQQKQESLQQFVLDSTPDEIQKIFDKMIVKRKWRTYMLAGWKHRMVLAEDVRNLYFGVIQE
jgi:hypothetical protein